MQPGVFLHMYWQWYGEKTFGVLMIIVPAETRLSLKQASVKYFRFHMVNWWHMYVTEQISKSVSKVLVKLNQWILFWG